MLLALVSAASGVIDTGLVLPDYLTIRTTNEVGDAATMDA